jgi:KEOPS complex subunit Pcc1
VAIEATLEFFYADSHLAETVERSVRLDAGDIQGDRSAASVERDGDRVIVRIEADDPAALRAAKRTWCSQIAVAEETAVAAS